MNKKKRNAKVSRPVVSDKINLASAILKLLLTISELIKLIFY